MSSGLRVAIVGYGLAGSTFHAPFIAATEGLEVAAIVTRNPERRARAQHDFPEAAIVDDAALVWADPDAYNLVVVAAANDAHAALSIAALQAGLPVVVDKPMASSSREAEAMIAAARAAGRMLTVFHNRRWDADFLTARRVIADGALGQVARLESRFERFRPAPREGTWRESPDAAAAGGVLFDIGPHLIDQACVLFGPPLRVYAELAARRPGAQVDDDAFVALEHAGGVNAHLWASQTAAIAGPRLRLSGLRGAFEQAEVDPQEDALRAGQRPGGPDWGIAPPARLADADGQREVRSEPGNYLAFYEGVRDAIADGAPPPVEPEDGLRALRVIEAARRSAAERAVVEF